MRIITHTFMITLGWLLLIPGLVIVILPPPFAFGVFLVVPGVAILVAHSKFMRRLVQGVRARHTVVDRALGVFESRVPGWLSRSLKRTNPAARFRALRQKHRRKVAAAAAADAAALRAAPAAPAPSPLKTDTAHG
ncbi:hypothetical protein [Pyruvatibacter mobilis]|uniref:hypothetical protein n=1 Tax=Pyruvatibacter mobilis TaxID=1712261 RepID=UPI003BAC62BD